MHIGHMIYNWALYAGFCVGATLDLPHCNIFLFQAPSAAAEIVL